jgi:hypothetical protein
MPPLNQLSNKDCNVLAEIMRRNAELSNSFKVKEDPKKWELVFASSTRKEMRETLSLTEASFNNSVSLLRKAGIIKGGGLSKAFVIYPSDVNKVTFEFRIEENGTELQVREGQLEGAGEVE